MHISLSSFVRRYSSIDFILLLTSFVHNSDPVAMSNVYYSKLSRSLRRLKESVFPQSPRTVQELVSEFNKQHIDRAFGTTRNGGQFFHGVVSDEGYSCAIFASTEIMELIENHIPPTNRVYLADATFKVVPVGFFTQLFVIYVAYEGDIFPLCYVLMSKKTEEAYRQVFAYIEQHIFQLQPTKMMMDFEGAMRKSFKRVHPGVIVLGCWFHHNQAIRRRASRIKGFFAGIYADPELIQAYRKFLKLPLLPSESIAPAFQSIKSEIQAKTTVFNEFLEYYQRQWITKVITTHYMRIC